MPVPAAVSHRFALAGQRLCQLRGEPASTRRTGCTKRPRLAQASVAVHVGRQMLRLVLGGIGNVNLCTDPDQAAAAAHLYPGRPGRVLCGCLRRERQERRKHHCPQGKPCGVTVRTAGKQHAPILPAVEPPALRRQGVSLREPGTATQNKKALVSEGFIDQASA